MKFAISAGHFEAAQGAVFEGFAEWPEACKWQAEICRILGEQAYQVPHDTLSQKIAAINHAGCDAALEIHFNASFNHKGSGHETLYMPGSLKGVRLASFVNSALVPFCAPNRGAKEGWYKMETGGAVDAFLSKTHCPAVIVEPFFIHEVARIEANREACCASLAQALLEWAAQ